MNKAVVLLACIFAVAYAGPIEDYQDRLIVSNLNGQQWYGVFKLSDEGVTKLHQVAYDSVTFFGTTYSFVTISGMLQSVLTDNVLIGSTLLPIGRGFNSGSRLIKGTGSVDIYLEDNDTKYYIDACIYSKIFSGATVNEVTPAHINGLIDGPDITC